VEERHRGELQKRREFSFPGLFVIPEGGISRALRNDKRIARPRAETKGVTALEEFTAGEVGGKIKLPIK